MFRDVLVFCHSIHSLSVFKQSKEVYLVTYKGIPVQAISIGVYGIQHLHFSYVVKVGEDVSLSLMLDLRVNKDD